MGKSVELIFIEELERRGLKEKAQQARTEFLILGRDIFYDKGVVNCHYKSIPGLTDRELLSLLKLTGNPFFQTVYGKALRYLRSGFGPEITSTQVRKANSIARQHGYGSASTIVIGDEDKILEHTPSGYRKYTTGEYVPNKYRSNFGWKNTYYQHAITTVMVKST